MVVFPGCAINEAIFPNIDAIFVSIMDSIVNFLLKSIANWQPFQSGRRPIPTRIFKRFIVRLEFWDGIGVKFVKLSNIVNKSKFSLIEAGGSSEYSPNGCPIA
jgi:hypothetical protein